MCEIGHREQSKALMVYFEKGLALVVREHEDSDHQRLSLPPHSSLSFPALYWSI